MSESTGMLRHLAFFEELAATDDSDSGWRSVSAGLVVMRLVDRWMNDGSSALTAHSVTAVRATIDEMPVTTPVRRILGTIVDAMQSAGPGEMHVVTPRLMAYGQALEYESKFSMAADVYRMIVAHAHPVDDSDIAIPAHTSLASTLLHMGDLIGAAAAYDEASRVASSIGDVIGVLRAQVGRAKVCIALGNIPQAEFELDDAILRAAEPGLEDVRSRALHDRAHVAALRGQYERTVQFAYAALEIATSQRERDRILGDIAAGFTDLGLLHVARDAYLVLVATAQEQYVRWMAELNLLEIAAREGAEGLFDRYRHDLDQGGAAAAVERDLLPARRSRIRPARASGNGHRVPGARGSTRLALQVQSVGVRVGGRVDQRPAPSRRARHFIRRRRFRNRCAE